MLKHALELAALLFFAICLGGTVWFCAFRNRGRDPWPTDLWYRQQKAETGPLEGVVTEPALSLDARVRATLARADRVHEQTVSMLAVRDEISA